MPTFFDEHNLTSEQKENWYPALLEYDRITRRVFPDDAIRSMTCTPGPKSALFARLLSGKPALPHPPPTAFSYPWYSVIEDEGPFEVVSLGHAYRLNADGNLYDIAINQCLWNVTGANEAGQKVLELLRSPAVSSTVSPVALAATVETYAKTIRLGPEIRVEFPNWPAYRLYIGRAKTQVPRKYMHDPNVMHALPLPRDSRVIRLIHTGMELYREQKRKYEKAIEQGGLSRKTSDSLAGRIRHLISKTPPRVPDDPYGDDLVEIECNQWLLERISD